jgi:hypothetical protein
MGLGKSAFARAENRLLDLGKGHEMGTLEQQQQIVDELNGEGLEVPEGTEPLDFLKAIYLNTRQPMARRLKAAIEAAQYRHPKLGVVASVNMNGDDYARLLDRAIERSGKSAEVRQIEHAPGTDPSR